MKEKKGETNAMLDVRPTQLGDKLLHSELRVNTIEMKCMKSYIALEA